MLLLNNSRLLRLDDGGSAMVLGFGFHDANFTADDIENKHAALRINCSVDARAERLRRAGVGGFKVFWKGFGTGDYAGEGAVGIKQFHTRQAFLTGHVGAIGKYIKANWIATTTESIDGE